MLNKIRYDDNKKLTVLTDSYNVNWYLGADVANILGYVNISQAINGHCKNRIYVNDLIDRVTSSEIRSKLLDYHTRTKFIPLEDVINLTNKCTKLNVDEISKFKTWLNGVVDNQIDNKINKNSEVNPPEFSSKAEEIITANTNVMNELLAQMKELRNEVAEVKETSKKNKQKADKFAIVVGRLAPKAKVYDQIAARKDSLTMEQTAKLISERFPHLPNANVIGRNILLRVLRAKGALTTKNIATQAMISAGYFTLKYSTFEGETYPCSTLVTPKGVEYIINVAKEFGYLPDISCPDVEEARQWASMLQAIRPASTMVTVL